MAGWSCDAAIFTVQLHEPIRNCIEDIFPVSAVCAGGMSAEAGRKISMAIAQDMAAIEEVLFIASLLWIVRCLSARREPPLQRGCIWRTLAYVERRNRNVVRSPHR